MLKRNINHLVCADRPFPYIQEFYMKNKLWILKSIWTLQRDPLLSGSINSMASSLNLVVDVAEDFRCSCPLDTNQTIRSSTFPELRDQVKLSLPSTPATLSTRPWGIWEFLMTRSATLDRQIQWIGDLCELCRHRNMLDDCSRCLSQTTRQEQDRLLSPLSDQGLSTDMDHIISPEGMGKWLHQT